MVDREQVDRVLGVVAPARLAIAGGNPGVGLRPVGAAAPIVVEDNAPSTEGRLRRAILNVSPGRKR